ncbi:MAG TPA: hypothetical protein VIK32_15090, partial [Candidatus Limnocylindrales bacterium]
PSSVSQCGGMISSVGLRSQLSPKFLPKFAQEEAAAAYVRRGREVGSAGADFEPFDRTGRVVRSVAADHA